MGTQTASLPRQQVEPDRRTLERGACLGAYELVLPLASGGMGRVWIAARRGDFGFSRMFAVKVMREDIAEREVFRRMFLAEAKLAARLRHTNVVEVFDLGEAAGTVYQAMELVDGDSLIGLTRRDGVTAPVSSEIAGRILVDVLRGLHAAHELTDEHGAPLDLVHRDVSPHNVLVGLDGVAKIADFGVARVTGLLGTDASGPVGKRAYMAPEQREGVAIDRRCDVFSAGVVLFELLTGERPPGSAPPSSRFVGDRRAAEAFLSIALRAMAPDPGARYSTADEMADALEEAAMRAGVTLSTKRVQAWVGELVGARISRQRADARREFEQSRFVPAGAATETATESEPHSTLPRSSSEPIYPMFSEMAAPVAPPSERARPLPPAPPPPSAPRSMAVVVGAVALAALAGIGALAGVVALVARPGDGTTPDRASTQGPAMTAVVESPAISGAELDSASAAVPSPEPPPRASASVATALSAAPSKRPIPRAPAGKSSTPSLPYDNPYKR